MTTFYRLQDKKGRGPFRPGFTRKWLDTKSTIPKLPPFYIEWPNITLPDDRHCACACHSLEQLRRWFGANEYRRLRKHGFHVVAIPANQVAILRQSENQCVIASDRPFRKLGQTVPLY